MNSGNNSASPMSATNLLSFTSTSSASGVTSSRNTPDTGSVRTRGGSGRLENPIPSTSDIVPISKILLTEDQDDRKDADKKEMAEHLKRMSILRKEAENLEQTNWRYESVDKLLGIGK